MARTCGNVSFITAIEPSEDALSATMTSAPSTFLTDCRSPGRKSLRKPSVFQFNMTTAVFIILMTSASAVVSVIAATAFASAAFPVMAVASATSA